MSKHTPGPWRVGDEHGSVQLRPSIRILRDVTYVEGCRPTTYVIGDVTYPTTTGETLGAEERRANARLIAAAPELLAVLREVGSYLADRSDVLDGDDGRPAPNPEMTLLREVDAAIAKATGDAP